MSPSQPEAKCDWARGGCAGAKSHHEFLIGFRVCEDGVNVIYPCSRKRGQVVGMTPPLAMGRPRRAK